MFCPVRCFIGVCALTIVAGAQAQPPDADRLAVDVLRDVHNRGAELYNVGDAAGAYRLYEGALLTIRPFLAHHPEVQKKIEAGLAEAAKAEGPKSRAFRLHEVIEDVRGRLKSEPKKDLPPKPLPKVEKVMSAPPAAKDGSLTGSLTLDGKPVAGAEVTLVTLDLPAPRVFSAKAADGTFAFPAGLPLGRYAALVSGTGVPEKFRTTGTSKLTIAISPGANTVDLRLMSK